jgi:D-sedoheptulose 7-phosphate isomerase
MDIQSDSKNQEVSLEKAKKDLRELLLTSNSIFNSTFLIGNGGSNAVCSHVAVDYCKFLRIRARTLNEPSMLTCIANDYGYDQVFSKQLEWQARLGDVLIVVSSSGESKNILRAAKLALEGGVHLVTCSGFEPDNRLRKLGGNINFYSPSRKYREVEISHLELLHSLVDV